MLRQEMNIGYFNFLHRPAEKLGVLDNHSDYEECRKRTHCNATHQTIAPRVVWDETENKYVLNEDGLQESLVQFKDRMKGMKHSLLGGGEHNNVYFPGFYHYKKNLPESLMQGLDGEYLELKDPDILEGKPIPMPGIDDPTLMHLYSQQLIRQAEHMRGCHFVIGYVLGAEMLYPEFFSLGYGDYRHVFWKHFIAWCEMMGAAVPDKMATILENSEERNLWLRFREQAMADRAAYYYQSILSKDNTHLCYYPTHGSTLHGKSRAALGQQSDSLLTSCDGIEMGHILIDNDSERRNVIMISLNASYGAPVIVPRLGNKTPDLSAVGGGRSFTPRLLRRFVYECVGMGVNVIYPIHWRSCLHDGEWFIKDTPAEEECRQVFDELTLAAPLSMGMGRLQPQIAVFAADDTWLHEWSPLWTGMMQDAFSNHVHMTVATDAVIDKGLNDKIHLLISAGNIKVSAKTIHRLLDYLNSGGKLLVWGEFADNCSEALRKTVLEHKNCFESKVPEMKKERILREMFLSGIRFGTHGVRYRFRPLDFDLLLDEVSAIAPDIVQRPFVVEGDSKGLNIYSLTDRAAMMAVCINNGEEDAEFTLSPDKRLLWGDLCARDAVTGDIVDMPMQLPAYGTRLVLFAKKIGDDFDEVLYAAEDAFMRWDRLNADVGALRHYYSGLRSGQDKEKRYSMAQALLMSLAIKTGYSKTDEGDVCVRAEVFNSSGEKQHKAKVMMRMIPGEFRNLSFEEKDEEYVCCIAKNDLPLTYDPLKMEYVTVHGQFRLNIQVESEGCQGGSIVNIEL